MKVTIIKDGKNVTVRETLDTDNPKASAVFAGKVVALLKQQGHQPVHEVIPRR